MATAVRCWPGTSGDDGNPTVEEVLRETCLFPAVPPSPVPAPAGPASPGPHPPGPGRPRSRDRSIPAAVGGPPTPRPPTPTGATGRGTAAAATLRARPPDAFPLGCLAPCACDHATPVTGARRVEAPPGSRSPVREAEPAAAAVSAGERRRTGYAANAAAA